MPELLPRNLLPPPAILLVVTNVADPDPDPGSGAFLPLGMNIPDLIFETLFSSFLGVKNACRSATLVVTYQN